MKSLSTLATSFILFALLGFTTANPLPLPQAAPPVATHAIILKVANQNMALCSLASQPARRKAELVKSKLVATGRLACKDSDVVKVAGGGTAHYCEAGQLVSPTEAIQTIKQACEEHDGLHSVLTPNAQN